MTPDAIPVPGGHRPPPPKHHNNDKPSLQHIEFRPILPKGQSLFVKLGPGFVVPSVTGGWQTTTRQRRRSLTEFVGADPVSMDIPVIFDGYDSNTSVEHHINRLYHLMRKQVGDMDQPRIISLHNFRVPFRHNQWVVNNITPGDEIRREKDSDRVQAQFIVTVLEYVEGGVITPGSSPAKKHKGDNKDSGQSRHYIVKKGDTLKKIAIHFYGKAKSWHVIAQANDIRDPDHLKVGKTLKIPAHD